MRGSRGRIVGKRGRVVGEVGGWWGGVRDDLYFSGAETTEIYTESIVGSVRCV